MKVSYFLIIGLLKNCTHQTEDFLGIGMGWNAKAENSEVDARIGLGAYS